jgi:hypothetical protein
VKAFSIRKNFSKMFSIRLCLSLTALLFAHLWFLSPASGEIQLAAKGQLSANATDKSGLVETLRAGDEQIPHNRLGGFSAIAYTGKDDLYWALPDRGPRDGATAYACRVQLLKIALPEAGRPLKIELVATRLLKTEAGEQLVGSAKAFDLLNPEKSLRFDCEGLRTGRRGQLFISDEYGPTLYEFSPEGIRQRTCPVPANVKIDKPDSDPLKERASNRSGRLPNGGMEGLAISPDGSTLWGLMQNPLIQDEGENGKYLRLISIPTAGGPSRQFPYQLESAGLGISEILAVNTHEFLCIERDSIGGMAAVMKKIIKIDVSPAGQFATEISQVTALTKKKGPASIQAVKKSEFINLLNPTFGLAGASFPKKVEGLTFGPRVGKKISLIVCSDNDFDATQPSQFFWFTFDESDLPGFQAQQFE